MTDRFIKGLLISSSLGLSACTVNSSHYSMRLDEWITDDTIGNVLFQYRAVPKYDYHFIWLGMREIDYLKQLDYRAVNNGSDHVCVQIDVNGDFSSNDYWKQNIVRDVTLVAPNSIKDLGFYILPRGETEYKWESDLSAFTAYKDGDKYTCEDPAFNTDCYITTAMCRDTGKPDDCAELQSLRKYRDEVMLNDLEGKRLVEEYYATAPKIVSLINQEPDHYEIYRSLRENYITPAAQAADAGNNAKALELYKTMVDSLSEKYKDRI
jgi:hypothetical protein